MELYAGREQEGNTETAKNFGDGKEQTGRELEVHFGDEGEPFDLVLYDNPTATAIDGHVGTLWLIMKQEFKELSRHRKGLLDALHMCQKQIDCLDYLAWQIEKKEGTR